MKARIAIESISQTLKSFLKTNLFDSNLDTAVIFYDLSFLKDRIEDLKKNFPPNTNHAIAIKANPLIENLRYMNELGLGAEAATLPEIYLAQAAGIPSDKIVFDSPAKTYFEIEYAIKNNIYINADSLDELERINEVSLEKSLCPKVGLRINPQVGVGKIEMTSVAGEYSKFGVPIKSYREDIIAAFEKYSWLNGMHLHVGSQGCSTRQLTEGVKTVFDLCLEVEQCLSKQSRRIEKFDIGGGLPVSYYKENEPPAMKEYADLLKKEIPELFSGKYNLVTEFGRYIYANTGWTASKVEYIKKGKDKDTAIIHVGADLLLRMSYLPDTWHHDISVYDKNGNIKEGMQQKYVLGGPLCFAGDKIADGIELPKIEMGDYIIIHDTGSYTLSMWSRYNSRQMPKIVGYDNEGEKFTILKERETPEELVKFWNKNNGI